jgi:hypothetical protein
MVVNGRNSPIAIACLGFTHEHQHHSRPKPRSRTVERTQIAKIITSHDLTLCTSGDKLVTNQLAAESMVVLELKQTKSKNRAFFKKNTQRRQLTTRYIEPGQGLVVPFGLIISVSSQFQ